MVDIVVVPRGLFKWTRSREVGEGEKKKKKKKKKMN